MASWSVQPFLQSTPRWPTQTDHTMCNIYSSGSHICSACMWSALIIMGKELTQVQLVLFCSSAVFNLRVGHTTDLLSHLSLSSVILIDYSTGSSVHVLILSIQAVHGLPRLHAPGIVPCIISFCRQLPCFLVTMYASFLALTVSNNFLFTPALLRTHSFVFFAVHESRWILLSPLPQRRQDVFLHSFSVSSFHSRTLLQATLAHSLVVFSSKSVCCDLSIFLCDRGITAEENICAN